VWDATERAKLCRSFFARAECRLQRDLTQPEKHEEMIMKYLVAMALLAVPLALASAPTPAEAGHRDGARCHMVKKTVWKFGKRKTKWVKVCRQHHRGHH